MIHSVQMLIFKTQKCRVFLEPSVIDSFSVFKSCCLLVSFTDFSMLTMFSSEDIFPGFIIFQIPFIQFKLFFYCVPNCGSQLTMLKHCFSFDL